MRFSLMLALFTVATAPLHAQNRGPFDHGLVLGAAWLQANALPFDRSALPSGALSVALRRSSWTVEAGWLRVARSLSTVQGVSLSVGRLLPWGRVLFIPTVGLFGGEAQASRDSTGYNWTLPGGTAGRVPRYGFSRAATAGGGAGLTMEIPIVGELALRATAAQWMFSGAPLEGDRQRTLLGAGFSLRFGR